MKLKIAAMPSLFRPCCRVVSLTLLLFSAMSSPAAAQLRGHWRLQETSGTTAVDTSPLSNSGTYTNGVALASSTPLPTNGAIAANFDGVNDYVTIPNEANYDLTGAMTVACWIKVDVFDADFQAIVAKGNTAWRLARDGSTNFVQFACTGLTTIKVVSTTSVNDGQWHHIAGVYTGSQLRIYVDGVLSNSVNSTGFISTNNLPVDIGRNSEAAGREFDGAISGVIVYNGALDAASIQAIYNWDGLTAHWKLNETAGNTATDSSILFSNGTYTNGPVLAAAGPYPGVGERAADFDGTNDYVAISNEYTYDLSSPMSVAAWIKVDSFTKAYQAIVTKGDSAWRLTRDNTTDSVRFSCAGLTTTSVSSVTSVNDGAWHHVVGVYTGSALQIYVDGMLDNSVAATGVISRNAFNVQIARNAEVTGKEFDGRIHDVRIYSVALSASRIAELYGSIGHWKLNQTSGTTALDSSVFAKHGAVTGTVNWSADCGGMGVFDFNGSTNYISTSNASHLQPTSALTIAAWVKGDSWSAGTNVSTILRKGEASPNNYQLAICDGKVEVLLDATDASGIQSNTVLSTGQWHHVAAIWDGSNVRIYVNGVLDKTVARTGTIGTDTRALYIGGRSGGTDLFDGMIRDVRFYNRAVYESEIKRLAGLLGYWAFSEGTGSTAADSSGQGNSATLSGGATWMTDCAGNKALQTNGAGGIAQTSSSFTPPDVGTVAFWMQSNGNPPALGRIFGVGGDWEARQMTDGTVAFDLCGEAGTNFVTTLALNEVGRWYHVAVTFDSATDAYAIYIDGQYHKGGTNSNGMTQQAAAILSFGTRTGSTQYWNGVLREFRVYSRRLCPSEIAELCGLAGYWRLDETSGATAADSSGLGRGGTVIGTPTWSSGAIDNGLELNGATRVEINSLLGSPKNVTLAAWARLTTADSSGAEIVSLGDYFAIRLDNGATSRAFFYTGSTWTSVSLNQTFAGTGWHHFAAVFNDDQDTCKLYLDGAEVGSLSTTVTIPYTGLGSKTIIGAHGNGGSIYDFTGKIDDVRVYSRALCPSEIQSLHDGGEPFEGVRIIKWVEIQ